MMKMKVSLLLLSLVCLVNLSWALPVTDGLVMHLDAGNLGLAEGVAVSSWETFSAAATNNEAVYVASNAAYNGLATVHFDGIDDFMLSTTVPFNVGSVTMIGVGNYENTTIEQYMISCQDGSGNDRMRFATDAGGYEFRIGSSGWHAINTGPDSADTAVHVFGITSTAEGIVDGVSVGTASNSSTETPQFITLGAINNGEKAFFGGDVAEILIYDRVLTSQEITEMTDYLTAKYVPEPATLALLSLGGLVLRRHK